MCVCVREGEGEGEGERERERAVLSGQKKLSRGVPADVERS